ncbi:MAG TPA: hypothetical protein VHD31_00810 [Candidatus Paceibacterota bacterium]|nr:hypothetical protein [Candidatus Paceibacterota bacterium]
MKKWLYIGGVLAVVEYFLWIFYVCASDTSGGCGVGLLIIHPWLGLAYIIQIPVDGSIGYILEPYFSDILFVAIQFIVGMFFGWLAYRIFNWFKKLPPSSF